MKNDKMNYIEIFEDKSKIIDLETLIATRLLVCANSGGGKSYAVRKILEVSYGKSLSIILDMEGEFHTLREKFNFLLMGGTKGDVPLNLKSARLLPKNILELNVPTIIDLSEFKKHDRILFVKDFLEALMELPPSLHKPCMVVIDEAHQFAGQQEKQDSTFAVIDLMTRGRKRGFCGVLCTQRIAKLHKDAVAEANNVMIGRTILDIDMARASEILGFTEKRDKLSLRDLKAGEFYVFGTAFNFIGIQKVKIAKVETTHPKVGMMSSIKISPPSEKIKSILSKLSDLPREAEKEIKDRSELIKKINELESKLRFSQKVVNTKIIETEEVKTLKSNIIELKKGIGIYEAERKQFNKIIANIRNAIKDVPLGEIIHILPKNLPEQTISKIPIKQPPTIKFAKEINETNEFGKCERAILKFLAMREGKEFTKSQVGALTNYASTSGGFNNSISKLKTAGLIKYSSGRLSILDVSTTIQILGSDYSSPESDSLEVWLTKLGSCSRKIYALLKENQTTEFTKDELGERTGYAPSSGGFNNSISELVTLGLAERVDGKIRFNQEILEAI